MAKNSGNKVVDLTKAPEQAEPVNVTRYRVLRNIRHGKIDLAEGDLVDLPAADAQHLVETLALAPHVTERQVSRVVDLTSGTAVIDATSAPVTGVEVAAADAEAVEDK